MLDLLKALPFISPMCYMKTLEMISKEENDANDGKHRRPDLNIAVTPHSCHCFYCVFLPIDLS